MTLLSLSLRKLVPAAACTLALLGQAAAQPVAKILGPESNQPGNLVILRTDGTTGAGHKWAVIPESAASSFLPILTADGQQAAVFSSSSPGTFVFVLAVAHEGQVALATHTLNQGGVTPPGPDPPGPDPPGPDPPQPGPLAFRALIIEETEQRPSLPASQQAILASPVIRNYLDTKTIKVDGEPEWRILDDDFTSQHMANWSQLWRDAYTDAKTRSAGTVPWLAVTNGRAGESRPLPLTVEETLQVLRKYGDN